MKLTLQSTKKILLATLFGAASTFCLMALTSDDAAQRQHIVLLETRVHGLEALLAQKEEELSGANFFASHSRGSISSTTANKPARKKTSSTDSTQVGTLEPANADVAEATINHDQELKDLMTLFVGDPRTFSEKVNEFIASDSSKEHIAIASTGIFNMADNRDVLPDHSLQSLYQDQTDADLKRVVAQVASMRGDNSLIDLQISEKQTRLKSNNPAERQKALVELAKTRYAGAANVIAPLLQDDDIGVKLDALLALRATGNQSHVRLVEALINDPNDSVSWLAKDVINNLQNLSERARTKLASNDIVAELPPIATQ